MNRRTFGKLLAAGAGAALLPPASMLVDDGRVLRTAPPLKPGTMFMFRSDDLVGCSELRTNDLVAHFYRQRELRAVVHHWSHSSMLLDDPPACIDDDGLVVYYATVVSCRLGVHPRLDDWEWKASAYRLGNVQTFNHHSARTSAKYFG